MKQLKMCWLYLLVAAILVFGLGYLIGSGTEPVKETQYVTDVRYIHAHDTALVIPAIERLSIPGKKIVHDTVIKDIVIPYDTGCAAFTFSSMTSNDTVRGVADCAKQQIIDLSITRRPLTVTLFDTVIQHSEIRTEVHERKSLMKVSAFGSYEVLKGSLQSGMVAEIFTGTTTIYSVPSYQFSNSQFRIDCGLKVSLFER